MKRRNVDCGKMRRPPVGLMKKNKISDGTYSSALLYIKFLLIWVLVLVADFILEFRFEYLWPLWLLIRSTVDSFRYQGLAFSVLFVCISIASDIVCYLYVPVQWLYFAASTYVWVQYVWHTDRGICLPTISLWLLFVYVETSLRLRDLKCFPFHVDLCRPFAVHCIGYPMVTLGFGFKSYVSYKLRLRKQKEVQKENEFYFQLLQQALPADQIQNLDSKVTSKSSQDEVVPSTPQQTSNTSPELIKKPTNNKSESDFPSNSVITSVLTSLISGNKEVEKQSDIGGATDTCHDGYEFIENSLGRRSMSGINDFKDDNSTNEQNVKLNKSTSRNSLQLGQGVRENVNLTSNLTTAKKVKSNTNSFCQNNKDETVSRMESEIKRIKAELQSSRNTEQELRCQINSLTTTDRVNKNEVYQLRQDNESLQTKLHNLVTSRQQDKQTAQGLERKLQEEKKQRASFEQQLASEKKKKADEAAKQLTPPPVKNECTDACKSRQMELEGELKQICWEMQRRDEQLHQLERETQMLRQYKESQNESEVLMSALMAMREKNAHLENNLSAETRLKMDLFSALGDAKRQIEIQRSLLIQKDAEIADLKTKVAEVMALVPSTSGFGSICTDSLPHFSAAFTSQNPTASSVVLTKSNLNPNASDYQPKVSM